MRPLLVILILIISVTACVQATPSPEPEVMTHIYTAVSGPVLNPERGFFTPYALPGPAGFSPVRLTGNTLVHLNIRLDEWREEDVPQDVLDGLDQNFADIRDAGVKAILRVAYNEGPYPDSEPDAPKAQILRHIEQLKPLFQKNGDVIAWVEAGFIGAWGEWHTSTNGLDNMTDKEEILNALLAALPANRMAQVRYPANIIELYADPMKAVEARVAHHNDCFLSSDTDVGTYERDGENTIARDQAYLAVLTRYTPMSGETCAPNPPRSDCASAIREMELLHFSAINEAYHKGILRSWEKGGCMEEMVNRLGYRLTFAEVKFNETVRPGGLLNLSVQVTNSGFAALMNPRPLYVVLKGSDAAQQVRLEIDAREWQPGSSSFTVKLRLPEKMAEGSYTLGLWLPDEAETLHNNPLYAVRFASEGVWDEVSGLNMLGQVTVDKTTTGSFAAGEELQVLELHHQGAVPQAMPKTVLIEPTVEPEAEPEVDTGIISDLQAAQDGDALALQFHYSGRAEAYNGFQVFLDTDQNTGTGFAIGGIGAEFLIENEVLNIYTGKGPEWNWKELEQVALTYDNAGGAADWRVGLGDLENPKTLDLVAQLVDMDWNAVELTGKVEVQIK